MAAVVWLLTTSAHHEGGTPSSHRHRPPIRAGAGGAVVRLGDSDIIRHPLVGEMLTVL